MRAQLYLCFAILFLVFCPSTFSFATDCKVRLIGSGERPHYTFVKKHLRLNVGDKAQIEFSLPGLNEAGQPIRGESSTLAYGRLGFFDTSVTAIAKNEELDTIEIQEVQVSDDKMAIQLVARQLTQAMVLESLREILSPELQSTLSKRQERAKQGTDETLPPAQVFYLQLGSPFEPNTRNKIELNIIGITAHSEDEQLNRELKTLFPPNAPVSEMTKFVEFGTEFKGEAAKEIFDLIERAQRKIPDEEYEEWLAEIPLKYRKLASKRRYRELTAIKINRAYEVILYVSNATQLNSMLSGLYALGLRPTHPIFRLGVPYLPHVAALVGRQ